jgi:hypothetical protein
MAQDLTPDQAIEQLRKLPEDQQRLVLGKLTPDALKAVRQKLEGPPVDWTANPKSEGTYKMTTNGTDFIGVPYSKVLDAWKAGYKIDDEDQMRFGKDKNEETMKQRREHPMNESHFAPAPVATAPPAPGTPLPKADFPESVSGDQHVLPAAGFWETARNGVGTWSQPEENAKWTNFAKRLGADLFGIADFPVEATQALMDSMSDNPNVSAPAMDQLAQMFTPEMAVQRVQEFKQEWKKNKNDAMNNAAADSLALFLAHKLGKAAGAAKSLAVGDEAARTAIRDQLDMPQRIERTVKKFGDESEKARNDLRAARQATAQENVETIRKHNEAKQEIEEKNEATLREEKNRVDTQQKLDTASKELDEKINAAEKKAEDEDNAAWEPVHSTLDAREGDISELRQTVEREKKNADPATSAIFNSILREDEPETGGGTGGIQRDVNGNPIINGQVRKVVSQGYELPVTNPQYAKAYKALYGEEPPPLGEAQPAVGQKLIVNGKEVPTSDPNYAALYEKQYGHPPPLNAGGGTKGVFSRLQRWYTFISNQLYSGGGRMEAGKYNALRSVLNSIDGAMQKIAKDAGDVPDPSDPNKKVPATSLLENARKVHQQRMEAFSDRPTEPGTVANYVRSKVTPSFTKNVRLEAYLTKLGAYDPSIPKLANHIDNLGQGLKKLPDKGPVRDRLQTPPPSPTAMGGTGPEHPVAAAANIPSNPLPKEGGPVPFGEKKAVGEKPDIAKINQENIDYLNDALRRYGRVGPWVVRLLSGGLVQHLLHGETSSFSGGLMFGQAVVTLVTSILRRESALEWLARPSEEDLKVIAKLPPEDAARLREAFKALAREEINQDPKKASIKIAPAAAVFLGTQSIQQQSLDQIKKEAEQLQSQEAPGPQSSAKPVWSHEFDPVSGNIVAV